MAIGSVQQRGEFVYVFDQQGRRLFTLSAGNEPNDGLLGYTSSSITIRRGYFIYVHNADGSLAFTQPAR